MQEIIQIAHAKNLSFEFLENYFLALFTQHQRLDFLIDRTLIADALDDLVAEFHIYDIGWMPIAEHAEEGQKPPLFLLRIEKKELLLAYLDEIIRQVLRQCDAQYEHFIIAGWGYSRYDLSDCASYLSHHMIAYETSDEGFENTEPPQSEQAFIFRWYDPRVLYLSLHLIPENISLHALTPYANWEFSHALGVFSFQHNLQLSTNDIQAFMVEHRIRFDYESSKILDLYEDVHLVHRLMAQNYPDYAFVHPLNSLGFLYEAQSLSYVRDAADRVYYALMCYQLDANFIQHIYIQKLIQRYSDRGLINILSELSEQDWNNIEQDILNKNLG